jgi:hypothetical protein
MAVSIEHSCSRQLNCRVAQRLLLEVTKKVPEKVLRAYGSVVQAKFEYEYSGDVFTPAAARRLLVKAEVFYGWAQEQLR